MQRKTTVPLYCQFSVPRVTRRTRASLGTRHTAILRLRSAGVCMFVIACLAALPTATAGASASSAKAYANPVSGLSASEVEKVLAEAPLGGAGGIPLSSLEVPQLAKLLAQLKGLSGLSGLVGLGGVKGLEQS